MTKTMNKLQLAILSDVFATVASRILTSPFLIKVQKTLSLRLQDLNTSLSEWSGPSADRFGDRRNRGRKRFHFQLSGIMRIWRLVYYVHVLQFQSKTGINQTGMSDLKMKFRRQVLKSSTKLQNKSFVVVNMTRAPEKCRKKKQQTNKKIA